LAEARFDAGVVVNVNPLRESGPFTYAHWLVQTMSYDAAAP